ncbi:MAG TPA: PatB family C-S lyase [Anaerolineales bacterium]|nr:PatB family C-S lyase [Anaerolineales bacterium]
MRYDFDQLPDRRATECNKWHHYPEDVLPMWVADMDFVSPEPVVQALLRRVEHGVFGYPNGLHGESTSMHPIRLAVVGWLEKHFNWQIEPEHLVFIPGVVTGFNLACHTLEAPREGVLIQTPVYEPILKAARQTGKIDQQAPLARSVEGVYSVDWDSLTASFNEQSGMLLLCNPHNPVGRVFNRVELERLADLCLRHEVLICSDEIHSDLVYPETQHIPIASLDPEIARHTITLMAPSKTFNLAGLKFSYAIIQNPELRKKYWQANKGLVGWINVLAQVAAQAAYEGGQEWLSQLLVYLQANRDYLSDFVLHELPGISMVSPEGTYLAWLDCREAGLDDPYQFFLENARVALNDGVTFGYGGQGFVRLNFGCPRSILVEALQRMRRALVERKG